MLPFARVSAVLLMVTLSSLLCGCPDVVVPVDPNPPVRLFKTAFRYTTGTAPSEIAVLDVNGDTLRDLITANRSANTVSVLLAKQGGGYAAKVDYPVGTAPAGVQVGDLNKDGKPDIVTANADSDNVSVLLGVGDGTFGTALTSGLLSGAIPAALALADLDLDTQLDVAVACSGNNTVSVLYGVGDGTFELVPVVLAAGLGPRSISVADLDLDTRPDLITANRDSNNVSLFFANEDFTYTAAPPLNVGGTPRMARGLAVNSDAWPDLVVSNPGTGDLSVLLAVGDGSYQPERRVEIPFLPTRFAAGDFDGDLINDLAVLVFGEGADAASLGLAVLLKGDGLGDFKNPRFFGAGADALDIQALRMDADTRLDLVTAGGTTANVVFGSGPMAFESEERFAVGLRPRAIAAEDFNKDNKRDLLVTNLDSSDVSLLLGNGNGTFQPQVRISTPGIARAIATGFINADAFADFVVTDLNNSRVVVYLGRGDGTFFPERLVGVRVAGENRGSQPRSVALADMNNDTKLDIVTGNAGTDSVAILLGKGDGDFLAPQEFFAFNFPLDVTVRDFNRDGKLDVAVCNGTEPDSQNATAPRVNVIFGKGDGTLDAESRTSYTTGDGPRGLAVGDLTGEGDLEAITVNQGSDRVFVLEGRTGGKLSLGQGVRAGFEPNSVAVGDFNRDNKLDVLTTNDGDSVAVVLNNGSLSFRVPMEFPVGSSPIGGFVGDVNGDGRPDVVTANRETDDISVLLGAPQ